MLIALFTILVLCEFILIAGYKLFAVGKHSDKIFEI
jgi:hypothetical protein